MMSLEEAAQQVAEYKAQMTAQLNSLDAEYQANLQFLVQQALDPRGMRTFSIPKQNIMSENDFPLFLTWYLQDNGVNLMPFFYMNLYPDIYLLELK
jgi:hypothetical protein